MSASSTAATVCCLKKDAFESWLKGARPGFADLEAGTDLGLPRAINFGATLPALIQKRLNGARGQRRGIAVAAEVTEHNAFNAARGQQLFDHGGGGGVGKMTVTRLDALFHRPGTVRIVLQHFLVVIRLDHESMHFAQPLGQQLGGVTEIGDETEGTPARVQSESDRLDRVVRHGKSLHNNVADGKFRPGPEEAPVPMLIEQTVATNGFSRQRVAINRHGKFPAQDFETANMIAVLMREKHAIELLRGNAALLETADELARAQAAIDQNPAMIGRDERAISSAAAAEHGQTEHVA
jgi:hypothetical protein